MDRCRNLYCTATLRPSSRRGIDCRREPGLGSSAYAAAESCRQVEITSQQTHMGIDIYARWENQTGDEVEAQYEAAMTVEAGDVGYLREAYHGEPYATRHLVAEAFASKDGFAFIPAATLRERLPETLRLAERRERQVYRETRPEEIERVLNSYTAFVELCERVERETSKPVRIVASW